VNFIRAYLVGLATATFTTALWAGLDWLFVMSHDYPDVFFGCLTGACAVHLFANQQEIPET
jgi:hypothetical protein